MNDVKFEAKVLKLIDKETVSNTHGTSSTHTTSSRGLLTSNNTATATNTVRTDKLTTLIFEDKDQDTITIKLKNEDFDVAKDKNTALYFLRDTPIAYIPSKKANVIPMQFLSDNDKPSVFVYAFMFILCCIPFLNILVYLGNLNKSTRYFENGNFTIKGVEKSVGVIALAIGVFGIFLGYSSHSLLLGGIITIIASGFFVHHMYQFDKKVYFGKLEILKKAQQELEAIRDQI